MSLIPITKDKQTWITVNDLCDILAKHYRARHVEIQEADIADIHHQWRPTRVSLGIGSVLSLRLDITPKEKKK